VTTYNVLELCAGAGGQSIGLDDAGFAHVGAVDIDADACATLRLNRPDWQVLEADLHDVNGRAYRGIDLLAGGVPCPPFSIAGKQLGHLDERDLFPQALRIASEAKPAAVMIENVRGLASARFSDYRRNLLNELERMGYQSSWRLLNASMYGVPQLRPRFILVALKRGIADRFVWPDPIGTPPTVGETLRDLMAAGGWRGAAAWARRANTIAPTIVGGSKKHGGPDLGPTRAREDWRMLGVDGRGIADDPPPRTLPADLMPRLTIRMVARLQGFPDSWRFSGRKTAAYRQVGNAFPPPVASAVGVAVRQAIAGEHVTRKNGQLKLAATPLTRAV